MNLYLIIALADIGLICIIVLIYKIVEKRKDKRRREKLSQNFPSVEFMLKDKDQHHRK